MDAAVLHTTRMVRAKRKGVIAFHMCIRLLSFQITLPAFQPFLSTWFGGLQRHPKRRRSVHCEKEPR